MAVQISGNDITVPRDTTVTRNLTVGGVLTYEDVTNVDSIGIVTARAGVLVGSGITLSKDGDIFATGVTTSTTFSGNFSGGTVSGTTGTFTGDVDIADKIIHTGDTDTTIRFPSADTIRFDTGGTEAARINSAQKLIIGDTNSDAQLGVYRSSYNIAEFCNTNADATGAEVALRKDSSSPADGDTLGMLKFLGDNDAGEKINYANIIAKSTDVSDGTEDGRLEFYTRGAGTLSERLRITSEGKLGINRTSPNTIIHALGNSTVGTSVTCLLQSDATANATSTLEFYARDNSNNNEICRVRAASGGAETVSLQFHTAGSERVRIDSSGNVIIRDTSASRGVQITNGNSTGTNVQIKSTNDSAGVQFVPGPSGDTFEYQAATSGCYVAYNRTDNTTGIFVKADGGTCFGATSTTSLGSQTGAANVCTFNHSGITLTAYGVVAGFYYDRINFTNSQYYIVNSSGTGVYLGSGATSWSANSDERLKINITELDGTKAYNHVKTARATSFNWNATGHSTDKKIGFIAQDWETNYPEVVSTSTDTVDGVENPKGIRYTETVPVLMAALKEAIAKIETLETEVAALKGS